MGYRRLSPDKKLATLPPKYTANVLGWKLDWRSPLGMEVAAEVLLLAQDLGGWESLSRQKQILVERAAYLNLRIKAYESAELQRQPKPFDAGTHSNKVNVLAGILNKLGIERQARRLPMAYIAGRASGATAPESPP